MSLDNVKAYFKAQGIDGRVLEFPVSSATVELAAQALGVIPGRIAKTLSFKNGEKCILLVVAGDARINTGKFKACFGLKPRMLSAEEALRFTGHAIGGVCPFAISGSEVSIYTDISLKRFETVFPACGSSNSAIELSADELFTHAQSLGWVDACTGWQEKE